MLIVVAVDDDVDEREAEPRHVDEQHLAEDEPRLVLGGGVEDRGRSRFPWHVMVVIGHESRLPRAGGGGQGQSVKTGAAADRPPREAPAPVAAPAARFAGAGEAPPPKRVPLPEPEGCGTVTHDRSPGAVARSVR